MKITKRRLFFSALFAAIVSSVFASLVTWQLVAVMHGWANFYKTYQEYGGFVFTIIPNFLALLFVAFDNEKEAGWDFHRSKIKLIGSIHGISICLIALLFANISGWVGLLKYEAFYRSYNMLFEDPSIITWLLLIISPLFGIIAHGTLRIFALKKIKTGAK
jgi:hypothetical protein